MTLGDVIKQYRYDHGGMSLRKFADRCGNGITHGYVSMLEKNVNPKTGRAITPSYEVFKITAKAMGMSVETLLAMIDGDQPISTKSLEETRDPRMERIQEIIDLCQDLPEDKLPLAQSLIKAILDSK